MTRIRKRRSFSRVWDISTTPATQAMQRATGEVALGEQCARSVLSEYESLDHEGSRLS
jgi:hypothetical protein